MKVELIDLVYAAGFIEADGCFHITSTGIGIRVTNRNRVVLNWFKETFGGTVTSKVIPTNCFHWNLHGQEAAELCRLLHPYLKMKQPEAECVISFSNTIQPRGKKVDIIVQTYREMLRDKLKEAREIRNVS